MRPRDDVVMDAKAATNIEQLVRAAMVRRIPPLVVPASVPPPARERDVSGGFQAGADNEFLAEVLDFFLLDENIKHLGSGDVGLAKFIIHEDRASSRLRAGLLGRLYGKFTLGDEQIADFELVFQTLVTEKFRKEVALAAQRERAQQNTQANAQVLGSSPSMMERLCSVYPKSESPYKQVPSSSAASSAQGSAGPTAISAQVRRCSPKLLPGERLGSVQLVCRMYTRIPEDDAPAEVERPRPRLRSQVLTPPVPAGRPEDLGFRV
jgi:hypothetical protein